MEPPPSSLALPELAEGLFGGVVLFIPRRSPGSRPPGTVPTGGSMRRATATWCPRSWSPSIRSSAPSGRSSNSARSTVGRSAATSHRSRPSGIRGSAPPRRWSRRPTTSTPTRERPRRPLPRWRQAPARWDTNLIGRDDFLDLVEDRLATGPAFDRRLVTGDDPAFIERRTRAADCRLDPEAGESTESDRWVTAGPSGRCSRFATACCSPAAGRSSRRPRPPVLREGPSAEGRSDACRLKVVRRGPVLPGRPRPAAPTLDRSAPGRRRPGHDGHGSTSPRRTPFSTVADRPWTSVADRLGRPRSTAGAGRAALPQAPESLASVGRRHRDRQPLGTVDPMGEQLQRPALGGIPIGVRYGVHACRLRRQPIEAVGRALDRPCGSPSRSSSSRGTAVHGFSARRSRPVRTISPSSSMSPRSPVATSYVVSHQIASIRWRASGRRRGSRPRGDRRPVVELPTLRRRPAATGPRRLRRGPKGGCPPSSARSRRRRRAAAAPASGSGRGGIDRPSRSAGPVWTASMRSAQ